MASVNQSWPIDKNDYFLMHLFAFNDLNYHSLDAHTHTKPLFSFILRSVLLSHLLPSLPLHHLLYSIIQNVQNKTRREGLTPSTLPLSNLFPSYWPFSLCFHPNDKCPKQKVTTTNHQTANFENAF